MMKNITLFGGGGFVGTNLSKLMSGKYDVTQVDIKSVGEKWNGQKYFKGDIRNLEDCKKYTEGADVVIHLAGELPHAGWGEELKKGTMWEIMVDGTENVLFACLHNKVKKVIYYSSSAVYGEPPKYALKEDAKHAPLDEYGKAKSKAEDICHEYMKKGLDITIIRPMTILGPGFVGILRSMMEFIYRGKKFPIIGDGSNRIQLIHIEDIMDATIRCIDEPKAKNETFNISSDMNGMPTIREELKELCQYARKGGIMSFPSWMVKPVLKFTNIIGKATMGKEIAMLADKTFLTDNSKAKKLLGWYPKYGNIEALEAGYDWFSNNHEKSEPNLSLPLKILIRLS
jgi:nucleoside-diphosphate-sugar epimerase